MHISFKTIYRKAYTTYINYLLKFKSLVATLLNKGFKIIYCCMRHTYYFC
jgi:hypothetical protein